MLSVVEEVNGSKPLTESTTVSVVRGATIQALFLVFELPPTVCNRKMWALD
jgi:hypothetical protein